MLRMPFTFTSPFRPGQALPGTVEGKDGEVLRLRLADGTPVRVKDADDARRRGMVTVRD